MQYTVASTAGSRRKVGKATYVADTDYFKCLPSCIGEDGPNLYEKTTISHMQFKNESSVPAIN